MKAKNNFFKSIFILILMICLGFTFAIHNQKNSQSLNVSAEEESSDIKTTETFTPTYEVIDGTHGYNSNFDYNYLAYTNSKEVLKHYEFYNDAVLTKSTGSFWDVSLGENEDSAYVVLKVNEGSIYLNAYTIYANIFKNINLRDLYNPKSWELYGTNSYDETNKTSDKWKLIQNVSDSGIPKQVTGEQYAGENNIGTKNIKYTYQVHYNQNEYQYYKFVFYPHEGEKSLTVFGIALYGTPGTRINSPGYSLYDCTDGPVYPEYRHQYSPYEGIEALFDGQAYREYNGTTYDYLCKGIRMEISKEPYIVIKFSTPVVLKGYVFTTSGPMTEREHNPDAWVVYAGNYYDPSNPDDYWEVMDEVTDDTQMTNNNSVTPFSYNVDNEIGYSYYKIKITETISSDILVFSRFQLQYKVCDHNYIIEETDPTCTTDGYKQQYCQNCNHLQMSMITGKATGHNFTYHPACPATYEAPGISEGYYSCSKCNSYYKDETGKNKINDISDYIIPQKYISFTVVDGKAKSNASESYDKLFDGKKTSSNGTKYCLEISKSPYVVVEADKEFMLKSYKFYTANDTASYSGRNPATWKVYGCNDFNTTTKTGTWVEVDSRTNDTTLKATNYTPYTFTVPAKTEGYAYRSFKYYKFEFIANQAGDDELMQLAEIELDYQVCEHAGNKVTNLATCTQDGLVIETCNTCGWVTKETITSPGHNYSDWSDKVPATCKTNGTLAHKTCTVCGKHFDVDNNIIDDLTILATGHKYGTVTYTLNDDKTKMTATHSCTVTGCTEEGHEQTETVTVVKTVTQEKSCTQVEKSTLKAIFSNSAFNSTSGYYVMTDQVTAPATGHKYGTVTYTLNEDKTKMTATHSCTVTGCTEEGHEQTETVTVVKTVTQEKSCTQVEKSTLKAIFSNSAFNSTSGYYVMTDQVTAPATGHKYGTVTYTLNEDKTEMTATHSCTVTGCTHSESETATTTKTVTQEKSCTLEEKSSFTASFTISAFNSLNDLHVMTDQVTAPATGHKYGTVTYTLNEDKTQMTATHSCTVTGCTHSESETANTDKTVTQQKSCTLDEISDISASFNNSAFNSDKVYECHVMEGEKTADRLGHKYGTVIYTLNDDKTKMTATHSCIITGCTHSESETANTDQTVTQQKSCTQKEISSFTASFTISAFNSLNDLHIMTNVITADETGHDYDEPTYQWLNDNTLVVATCVCKNDNKHIKQEESAASYTITQQKSCTQPEITTYTAIFENFPDQTKEVETAPASHTFGDAYYIWAADNKTVTGYHQCTVDGCGHIETETVNVTITVTDNKTCIYDELSKYEAIFTKKGFTTQTINGVVTSKKLGHHVGDENYKWIEPVEPTCKKEGNIGHYKCDKCKNTFDENHNLIFNVSLPTIPHTFDDDLDPTCNSCDYKRIVIDYTGYTLDGKASDFMFSIAEGVEGITLIEELEYGRGLFIFNTWDKNEFNEALGLNEFTYFLPNQKYGVSAIIKYDDTIDTENLKASDFKIAGLGGETLEIKIYPETIEILFALPLLAGVSTIEDVPALKYELTGVDLNSPIKDIALVSDSTNTINPEFEIYVSIGNTNKPLNELGDLTFDNNIVYYINLLLFAPENYSFINYTESDLNILINGFTLKDYFKVEQAGSLVVISYKVSFRTDECAHTVSQWFIDDNDNEYHFGYCDICLEYIKDKHIFDDIFDFNCNICNENGKIKLEELKFEITGYEEGKTPSDVDINLVGETNPTFIYVIEGFMYSISGQIIEDNTKFVNSREYIGLVSLVFPVYYDLSDLTEDKISIKNLEASISYFSFVDIYKIGVQYYAMYMLLLDMPKLNNPDNPIERVGKIDLTLEGFEVGNTSSDIELNLSTTSTGVTASCYFETNGWPIDEEHTFKANQKYLLSIILKAKEGYDLLYMTEDLITVTGLGDPVYAEYNFTNGEYNICYNLVINDETHIHEYNEIYKYNYDYHWKVCQCGVETIHEAHQVDPNTFECTVCGYMCGVQISSVSLELSGYEFGKSVNDLKIKYNTIGVKETKKNFYISSNISAYAMEVISVVDLSTLSMKDINLLSGVKYYLILSIELKDGYYFDYEELKNTDFILKGYGTSKKVFTMSSNLTFTIVLFELKELEAPHIHGGVFHNIELPDCTNTGTKAYTECSICHKYFDKSGNEITDLVISKLSHSYGDWHEQVDSTCTKEGTKAHQECSICHKYFDKSGNEITDLVIPKLSHSYGDWHEQVDSTCTKEGTKAHQECSICHKYFDKSGNEITDLVISKLSHSYGDWHEQVDSTCTKEGTKAHQECSICHKYFDKSGNEITDLVIPKLSHSYGDWHEKVDPTCTKEGTKAHQECSICHKYFDKSGNEITDLAISKLSHSYGDWHEQVDSTCTKEGTKANQECSICHKYFDDKQAEILDIVIPKAEHKESDWIIDVEPTSKHEGKKHTECTECGEKIKEEIIPMTKEIGCSFSSVLLFACFSLVGFVLIKRRKW